MKITAHLCTGLLFFSALSANADTTATHSAKLAATSQQHAHGQNLASLLYGLQESSEVQPAGFAHELLLAGFNPDAVHPENGQTALHIAALRGDYRLATRLLAFGANPTIKDKEGKTPADLAHARELYAMLLTGTPVELKSNTARSTYAKACRGDADAQFQMHLMYNNGIGEDVGYMSWVTNEADPDAAESFAWLEQAAAQEHPRALYSLAMCYFWGVNMPADKARALRHLRRAAELGNEEAKLFLRDNSETP